MRAFAAVVVLTCCGTASATFHLWRLNQIYSDASGTVQYVELATAASGQNFLSGHALTASQGMTSHSFTFPTDLPGDTTNHTFLIATQGFASLGIVTPDYVVPNGFLFLSNATVDFAGVDSVTYATLPTDGIQAIDRSRNLVINSPTNFAGATGSVTAPVQPEAGLWVIDAENNGQPGRGFQLEVRSGVLVLTVFAYDAAGNPIFYLASGPMSGSAFSGDLSHYAEGMSFGSAQKSAVLVGSAGLVHFTFTDSTHGTITFPSEAAKAISKFFW
jgi:hypothetical protein